MSGTTTNFSWPFPTNGDVADVAVDMAALAAAADSTLGDAWTAYTPVWTGTTTNPVIGTGTIKGRYKRLGKWGMVQGLIVTDGTTTYGTGTYLLSLPAGWSFENTATALVIRGSAFVFDTSTTTSYVGYALYVSATTFAIRTHAATTNFSPTVPVTLATTDQFGFSILAELQ
jgi:hypothetical protein